MSNLTNVMSCCNYSITIELMLKNCDEVTIVKQLVYFDLCGLNSYCNDLAVDFCMFL